MTGGTRELRMPPNALPLLAALPAGVLGLGIMALYDSPTSQLGVNLAALLIGFVSGQWGTSVIGAGAKKYGPWMIGAVLVLVALTFVDPGIEGVHRWVKLGPVRLHPAAMLTPLLLWLWIRLLVQRRTFFTLATFGVLMGIHVAQPDAGQATAVAAAGLTIAAVVEQPRGSRIGLVGLSVIGAGLSWTRRDPLLPVPMVEDIVPKAFAMSWALGIAAIVALAWVPMASFIFARQTKASRTTSAYGLSFAAYFVGSVIAVGVGEFPTPLLGFGASPVLGTIWGLALLAHSSRIAEEHGIA